MTSVPQVRAGRASTVFDRTLFDDDHAAYRESFRRFLTEEVVPHDAEWQAAGIVPKQVFRKASEKGFVAPAVPEEYGGAAAADFRFNVVLSEESCSPAAMGFGMGLTLHNNVALPYVLAAATDEQRARWLPGIASGDLLMALAMTEPGTGSDLAALSTRAVRSGDTYTVNGAKTFITNGVNADLIITAVRTGSEDRHRGISLLMIDGDTAGMQRGRNLDKLGMHAQDTAELFFDDVVVPVENLLGQEGEGFFQMTAHLAQERLSIAINAIASARLALELTLEYVKERRAFGRTIGSFQHSRFTLAEMRTELEIGQVFLDRCTQDHLDGALTPEHAAMAKWWCTELQGRVVDRCVQLHGGYGYMLEYPIAQLYADARVTRIFGGSTEIMKEIIGKADGLG
jgi:alkylation response protein AidB-like acyl-CoA dehydrogenase